MNPLSYRYPGRFIVIGMDDGFSVAVYGATGRSAASLARQFVRRGDEVFMTAIDTTVSRERNPDLFEYPAVKVFQNGVVVANGTQISYALAEEAYEPDENKTPRITGCIVESQGANGVKTDAALHIVRFAKDGIDHSSWSVPLESGKGLFISTYDGADTRPAASFAGSPVPIGLSFGSAENAAKTLFEAFSPPVGQPDYRVGIVALYKRLGEAPEIAIVNRIG
jgi:IMP cyclohydrolase